MQDFVFVSYSSKNKKLVDEVIDGLRKAGVNLWIDDILKEHVGEEWFDPVKDRMSSKYCKGVLFFVSRYSVSSKQVLREIAFTESREVRGSHRGAALRIFPIEAEPGIDNIEEWIYDLRDDKEDERDVNPHWRQEQEIIDDFREICFSSNNVVRIPYSEDAASIVNQLLATLKKDMATVISDIPSCTEAETEDDDATVFVGDDQDEVEDNVLELQLIEPAEESYPRSIKLSLSKGRAMVGRYDKIGNTEADYAFPATYSFVSRKQFSIERKGEELWIEDLNSANGTYVNDVKAIPGQKVIVKAGDTIEIAKKHSLKYKLL